MVYGPYYICSMEPETLNRFDRIVAILIHLQSSRVVKAQDLADRFGVSLRTIYRDIRSLEASGVPISGEAGIGYSLVDGYKLPPVMFTREEAGSFVAAEKLMEKFSDSALGSHYQSAMYKVRSVLKGSTKERVEALQAQVWISAGQELFTKEAPDALDVLFDSIAERKQVTMLYQGIEADEASERQIEPVGLFHENNFWYVMGFCHLRQDYRQFRTDRMLQIRRTDLPYTRSHKTLEEIRSKANNGEKTRVVIRLDKKMAKYLKANRGYHGYESERIVGNEVELTFHCSDVEHGFPRWFMMFADRAEILEPESLRERVNGLLEKSLERLREPVIGN